jgi:SulP family sulfate permease
MLDRVGLGETSVRLSHAVDYARAQSLAVELIEKS